MNPIVAQLKLLMVSSNTSRRRISQSVSLYILYRKFERDETKHRTNTNSNAGFVIVVVLIRIETNFYKIQIIEDKPSTTIWKPQTPITTTHFCTYLFADPIQ